MGMDVRRWNREAWDRKVAAKVVWARPVDAASIARARQGDWNIILTPLKAVPRSWLGDVKDREVLCLAGAGGQQAPVLSAAGARVTVLDNSPAMLELDRQVASRDGLDLKTVLGDMADLSPFASDSFDLILHPVSNCFVPQVRPVWRESFRVLRPGGKLLSGFMNPVAYIFDHQLAEDTGKLRVRYPLPYADERDLPEDRKQRLMDEGEAFEFSHTLEDQLAGQLEAGFVLTGFYEDSFPADAGDALTRFTPTMLATCAWKPPAGCHG